MRVMKFSGSSMPDARAIRRVGELVVGAAQNEAVVVVVSAFGGVTDSLFESAGTALSDYERSTKVYAELHKRHMDIVTELIPASDRGRVVAEVQILFNNLEDVLHGVHLVRECSLSSKDLIVSYGELLSSLIVARFLDVLGIDGRAVDARQLILTSDRRGAVIVDLVETRSRIRQELLPLRGVAVVTGYIASNADGVTTILGRSRSDYSATLVGSAIGAERIELWTDVDGIFNADPRTIKDAQIVSHMTFQEAQELAYFGAQIVHPQSLQPAADSEIPVVVRNTFNPDHPGTVIAPRNEDDELPVRGISTVEDVAMVNLEGSGMIGVLGIAGRMFTALAERGVNIIMISQASSEHSICFVTRSSELTTAVAVVEETFTSEFEAGLIQRIEHIDNLAVLSVIGSRMRGTVGLSARFFGALGEAGVNVLAISQGASERNVSIVISGSEKERAMRTVHQAFELGRASHRLN